MRRSRHTGREPRVVNWRVNMTAAELDAWLLTPESHEVGFTYPGEPESVGHASGRMIVKILQKGGHSSPDLTEAERAHVRKVAGYNARHLAQRPKKSPAELRRSRWYKSLKNWGHDALK